MTNKETVLKLKGSHIQLGHGSGGKLSSELIEGLFLPAFTNPILNRLNDQAVFNVNGSRLAFTTDSFVVNPLFFPGGDIGTLAVNGTINDLAMSGANPLYLSAAFILEEGFPLEDLRRIVASMQRSARDAGVSIVTGDTKVVEKGQADRVFINTAGIGLVPHGVDLSAEQARPGDKVLLSGRIGDHGMTILAQREGLAFETPLQSDTAPLHGLVSAMLPACRLPAGQAGTGREISQEIRCMRDPTRGGVAATLNEIAQQSSIGIAINEDAVPVGDGVRGLCEFLGLDPLHVANEGKLVAIVAPDVAEPLVSGMRSHPLGREATIIGEVVAGPSGMVTQKTCIGGTRIVEMLSGDQLPRIC